MLLKSLIARITYKLFVFLMASSLFSGAIATPPSQAPIVASEDANLVFAAIADPQVSIVRPERYRYFCAAAEDLKAARGLDAMLIAGDMAECGLDCEYQLLYDNLGGMDLTYFGCIGNHDIRTRIYGPAVKKFTNVFTVLNNGKELFTELHYTLDLNGYKFIVLGTDRTEFEEAYLSPEQLKWVDEELAKQNGEPTFVLVHQPFMNTAGLPGAWNSPIETAGSIGKQNDELRAIFNKYRNVIFITGHLHSGFGKINFEKIDNFYSVNLPSLSCKNDFAEYNEQGLAYIAEVYDNHVTFKARDCAQAKWVPEYDYTIQFEGVAG